MRLPTLMARPENGFLRYGCARPYESSQINMSFFSQNGSLMRFLPGRYQANSREAGWAV
jgi:hypothetical protein